MKRPYLKIIFPLVLIGLAGIGVYRYYVAALNPTFGTTVSETAVISNNQLTLQLEFMDTIHLPSGERVAWSEAYQAPYIAAAQKWLSALIGVEGKPSHTIVIQITVDTFGGGNGAAGPSQDERVGIYTFPAQGELIIGNHTYEPGFDPVEFHANILHEIGHIIGIGSYTEAFTTTDKATGNLIFRGPESNKGAEFYNEIYGTAVNYVPISDDRGHLYDHVLQEDKPRTFADGAPLPPLTKEFMANGHVFGNVTLGVLDDIGYVVDYAATETYVP
ncbi:MAG: hypothetical protein AAF614_14930 [Chloroflexota bacterium]